jgi:hypothetical protein
MTRLRPGHLLAASFLSACGFARDLGAPKRIEALKARYTGIHARFEKAVANDPKLPAALAGRGQITLAIGSGLIEELAATVAARYLDRVTLNLADVRAHSSGKLDKDTIVGRVKLGEWDVRVELGTLAARLRALPPVVALRPPDLVELELPVDVEESQGDARLHFKWNSAGVANLVCKDFETSLDIEGRVLPQRHTLKGALRLTNAGGRLTETPLFPDRKIQVLVDLTEASWTKVEEALKSQDTLGKCGMFAKAADGMAALKALAARGIAVTIPDKVFRAVHLPAQFQETVQVNQRPIGVRVTAEGLTVRTAAVWSSVSVQSLPRKASAPAAP